MSLTKITIAVQSSGRLRNDSMVYLNACGVNVSENDSRALLLSDENNKVDVIFVRHNDIPQYLLAGTADLGIVGENLLFESDLNFGVPKKLGFGKCSLVIAVFNNSLIKDRQDLEGERIATAYPNSLRKYLNKFRINASIIEVSGSVEVSVKLGMADAICDITQTGSTLKSNNLIIFDKVMDSEAVLIKSPLASSEKLNRLSGLGVIR